MDAKLIYFFLATMVISQAYAAATYKDSYTACMAEFKLKGDVTLTNFMKNGKFDSDDETSKLKCIFHCLSSKLETSDAEGNMNYDKLKKLAVENPTENELQLFSSEKVKTSCIDTLPAKYAAATTPCEKVYFFTLCGLENAAV